MKKSNEFITYQTLLQLVNPIDYNVLNDCISIMYSYTTSRFAYMKKNDQINKTKEITQKNADNYRNTQVFKNDNKDTLTVLDARYSRAIDIDIDAKCLSRIECYKDELEAKKIKKFTIEKKYLQLKENYDLSFKNKKHFKKEVNSDKKNSKNKELNKKHKELLSINKEIKNIEKEI